MEVRVFLATPNKMNNFKIIDNVIEEYTGSEKTVVIPNFIKRIGMKSFAYNDKIQEVIIPANVEYIDSLAFDGSSLKRVYILNPKILIDVEAFDHCYDLSDIYFRGSKEEWDSTILINDDIEELIIPSEFKIHFNYYSYEEIISGINDGSILEVTFAVSNYNHYRHCVLSRKDEYIELTLNNDEVSKYYGEFLDKERVFLFKGKGKFNLKEIYNNIEIIELKLAPRVL